MVRYVAVGVLRHCVVTPAGDCGCEVSTKSFNDEMTRLGKRMYRGRKQNQQTGGSRADQTIRHVTHANYANEIYIRPSRTSPVYKNPSMATGRYQYHGAKFDAQGDRRAKPAAVPLFLTALLGFDIFLSFPTAMTSMDEW